MFGEAKVTRIIIAEQSVTILKPCWKEAGTHGQSVANQPMNKIQTSSGKINEIEENHSNTTTNMPQLLANVSQHKQKIMKQNPSALLQRLKGGRIHKNILSAAPRHKNHPLVAFGVISPTDGG